jgi:SRSO17 transposase
MTAATETSLLYVDPIVHSTDVAQCTESLSRFIDRYRPLVYRTEQEEHLQIYLQGLVGGLERKSIEPIATAHGLYRRPLQHFVGAGKWSDPLIRSEMQHHVVEEIGSPDGVLVLDGSGFPKSGPESVGVQRQWCGRLGKIENCQVGIFLAYSALGGIALLDGELYLPESWASDRVRRDKCHVPDDVEFKTNWQLADALLERVAPHVPHSWITADDEFGRPTEFRDRLADRGQRYLLEVPSNTLVRKPSDWPGRARKWRTVAKRKQRRPLDKWKRIQVRDGEKGPIEVFAFCTRVETKRDGAPPQKEVLLVMQTITGGKTWYFLAPAGTKLNSARLVGVAAHRNHVEQAFEMAKGEVGFDHYEVRSFVGWHHHITLSMLALWFLAVERRRLGKKLLQ